MYSIICSLKQNNKSHYICFTKTTPQTPTTSLAPTHRRIIGGIWVDCVERVADGPMPEDPNDPHATARWQQSKWHSVIPICLTANATEVNHLALRSWHDNGGSMQEVEYPCGPVVRFGYFLQCIPCTMSVVTHDEEDGLDIHPVRHVTGPLWLDENWYFGDRIDPFSRWMMAAEYFNPIIDSPAAFKPAMARKERDMERWREMEAQWEAEDYDREAAEADAEYARMVEEADQFWTQNEEKEVAPTNGSAGDKAVAPQ